MAIIKINPIKFYRKVLNTYIKDDNRYKSVFSKLYDYLFKK